MSQRWMMMSEQLIARQGLSMARRALARLRSVLSLDMNARARIHMSMRDTRACMLYTVYYNLTGQHSPRPVKVV